MLPRQPKTPKYWQLVEDLRRQIESGELPPGSRLPSVAETQQRYNISLSTVDKAHSLLEQEGLIVREQGRGTFVAENSGKSGAGVLGLVMRTGISQSGLVHQATAQNIYSFDLLAGIREEAKRHNLEILWLNDDEKVDVTKLDAILMYCDSNEALAFNLPAQLPQVLLFHRSPDFTCIVADDFAGGRLATQHLFSLGHRRIACVPSSDYDSVSRQRLGGYREALQEAGLPSDESQIRCLHNQRELGYRRSGALAMETWLDEGWESTGCTAIVAHNDEAAIGIIKVLVANGIRVPQDVSVIGFDGTELSELSSPPLTTIKVPLHDLGVAAVQSLHRQLKGEIAHEPGKIILPVQLKMGESTGPAPAKCLCEDTTSV